MKKAFVSLVSALALFAAQASAQTTSDLGTWSSVQLVKSFGAPYAMARLEHRSYDHVQATECWFAMAGGGYNFNSWLKGDLSYESRKRSSAKAWPLHCGRSTNWPTIRMRERLPTPFARGSAGNTGPLRADGPLT